MAGSNSNSAHSQHFCGEKKTMGEKKGCLDIPNKIEFFFAFRSLSFTGFLKTQ